VIVPRALPWANELRPVGAGPGARWPHSFVLASLVFLLSTLLCARAVSPKLNSISPAGGQRGTEVDLNFAGSRLDDLREIVFHTPGLELLKVEAAKTNSVKARVRIAADCRLGEHLLRLRTATGVSELRSFYVGPFPTVKEIEPNNDPKKAQSISLDTTVAGTTGQEDVDFYEVFVKKGQLLSAEVEAIRLGRTALDSYVAIRDTTGAVLAASDDTSLLVQDSAVSILAPKDAAYLIEVRDSTYSGTAESAYRLHVGSFPRPLAVFPPGGKTGETLKVKFIGAAGGDIVQEIKLPAAPQDKFGVFAERTGHIAPSPNWLRVSAAENVIEEEPNDARERATATYAQVPLACNGIISQDKDVDWFKFQAKKGVALDVNVFARRLRSPLDSVLEVCDAKGKTLAQNDDSAGPDSSVKFTPEADGDYLVRIADQLGKGGPDYTYRIEITPSAPSLSLSIPQVARNNSQDRQYITVPKGNRFAVVLSAKRNSAPGDVALSLDGLPTGMRMESAVLPAKQDAMPLVFSADADAPVAGKLLDLVGATDKGVKGHFQQNVEFVYGPNQTVYYGARVDKIMVAVTEAAPFKVRIVEPKLPLVQAGTMDLKIIAERAPGFEEPIALKMLWNPPGLSSAADVTIPKGQTTANYTINSTAAAEPHTWKIAVLASANFKGGPLFVSSQLAPLEVSGPYVTGIIDRTNAEPGTIAKLVCRLEQKQPFEGKATVKLLGLPEKITASDVTITKDSKQVEFDLKIDPTISPGSHRALFCSVEIKKGNEVIHQTIGSGGVLRIVPPKKSPAKPAPAKVAANSK
jgi:hypothetical protein